LWSLVVVEARVVIITMAPDKEVVQVVSELVLDYL
jgi:hypothetical protein